MSPKLPSLSTPDICRQLSEINMKLSNVVKKGDGTIREMIKDKFQHMKDDFFQSSKRHSKKKTIRKGQEK